MFKTKEPSEPGWQESQVTEIALKHPMIRAIRAWKRTDGLYVVTAVECFSKVVHHVSISVNGMLPTEAQIEDVKRIFRVTPSIPARSGMWSTQLIEDYIPAN